MRHTIDHRGFEESVLYSNEDFEPYGFTAIELVPVTNAARDSGGASRLGPYERAIEAAVLRRLDTYPNCWRRRPGWSGF